MVWMEMTLPENIKELFMEMDNNEEKEDTNDVLGMDNGIGEDK